MLITLTSEIYLDIKRKLEVSQHISSLNGVQYVLFVLKMEYNYSKAKNTVISTYGTRLVLALE